MSQDHLQKLKCKECGRIHYITRKNKKQVERKLEFKKHCPDTRKHALQVETKK
ncbi:MAG: 50S ribosomal protein L33 [Candidatus Paceibacterota bacterium]